MLSGVPSVWSTVAFQRPHLHKRKPERAQPENNKAVDRIALNGRVFLERPAEKLRGHPRDGSFLRSLSWGRGAGRAYLSTPREESSRRSPLAAELGASAREDR